MTLLLSEFFLVELPLRWERKMTQILEWCAFISQPCSHRTSLSTLVCLYRAQLWSVPVCSTRGLRIDLSLKCWSPKSLVSQRLTKWSKEKVTHLRQESLLDLSILHQVAQTRDKILKVITYLAFWVFKPQLRAPRFKICSSMKDWSDLLKVAKPCPFQEACFQTRSNTKEIRAQPLRKTTWSMSM